MEQGAVHLAVDARIAAVEHGRRSYAERAWNDAYAAFSLAGRAAPLEGGDLELLATSAGMLGRGDDHLASLEQAHHVHLQAGETLGAVRCAFSLGMFNAERGELARATGWLGRARRLLEREDRDCVERGYLLITTMAEHEEAGDLEAAVATTVDAARIGERFDDADLVALALYERGRMLVGGGRVDAGLALFDEVMVAVCAGELSPMVTGILYCSVIASCQRAYELRRAREWTAAFGGLGAMSSPTWFSSVDDASCTERDPAAGRCMARCPGGGAACRRPIPAERGSGRSGGGVLPAGRDPPLARGTRRGRAGVSGGEPPREGFAAGSRVVAPGRGKHARRGGRDPSCRPRDRRADATRRSPARLRRDHVGGGRSRGCAARTA